MTWGLILLTVIVGGVRPSCICADGTLCLLCPKLMATPSAEPGTTTGSCSSMSCCCERGSTPAQSKLTSVCELAGSTCDGRDCLTIQAASPVIVQANNDPTSHLDSNVVPAMPASVELLLSRESHSSTGSTYQCGPPPDLIVLFQRWLI